MGEALNPRNDASVLGTSGGLPSGDRSLDQQVGRYVGRFLASTSAQRLNGGPPVWPRIQRRGVVDDVERPHRDRDHLADEIEDVAWLVVFDRLVIGVVDDAGLLVGA